MNIFIMRRKQFASRIHSLGAVLLCVSTAFGQADPDKPNRPEVNGDDAALIGPSSVEPEDFAAESPPDAKSDSPTELQARWEYYVPVPSPAVATKGVDAALERIEPALVDLVLGPNVFTHARSDLADLRLYDATAQPMPYALRYLRAHTVRENVPAEEFNRSGPDVDLLELTLDLKRDDIQHNEIEITMNGENFRRAVEADGSEDGKTWRRLAETHLLRFSGGDQKINLSSIHYPASRFRYVRVRVSPDPVQLDQDREKSHIRLADVQVYRRVDVPAEITRLPGLVRPREPVRTYGAPGSAWIIDLGGDRVPCDRIEADIADAEFARDVRVEYELPSEPGTRVLFAPVMARDSLWQRRTGEPKRPMVLTFDEVQTSRLKLFVTDHRNPPLTIRGVKFGAPARQVVFARRPSDPGELRLYFGNPHAEMTNYDFARNLPPKLAPSPTRVPIGVSLRNPNFVPPPQPFTERFPWLIYAVLGSVTVILAAVIASLSRTAIAIHDATTAHEPATSSV